MRSAQGRRKWGILNLPKRFHINFETNEQRLNNIISSNQQGRKTYCKRTQSQSTFTHFIHKPNRQPCLICFINNRSNRGNGKLREPQLRGKNRELPGPNIRITCNLSSHSETNLLFATNKPHHCGHRYASGPYPRPASSG